MGSCFPNYIKKAVRREEFEGSQHIEMTIFKEMEMLMTNDPIVDMYQIIILYPIYMHKYYIYQFLKRKTG